MAFLSHGIKHRTLTVSFLLIIGLFLSFGIVVARGLFALGELTRTIYEHPLVVSNASLSAALNTAKMHRSMKDVVLAASPEERETALRAVAEGEAKVHEQLDVIHRNILGREGELLEDRTHQLFVDWKPIRDEVVQLLESGDRRAAVRITKEKGADHVLRLESRMLELTAYARNKADGFMAMAEKNQSTLERLTVVLTVAGVLLSALIAFVAVYRVMTIENALIDERNKLRTALDEIKTLHGIIPICSYCKEIRDDEGVWQRMEKYIQEHSEADFSHGICPACIRKHFPEMAIDVLHDGNREN